MCDLQQGGQLEKCSRKISIKDYGYLTFVVCPFFSFPVFEVHAYAYSKPVHSHHSRHFHPTFRKLVKRRYFPLYTNFFFKRSLKNLVKYWPKRKLFVSSPFDLIHHTSFSSINTAFPSHLKEGDAAIFTLDSVDSWICPTCDMNPQVRNPRTLDKCIQDHSIVLCTSRNAWLTAPPSGKASRQHCQRFSEIIHPVPSRKSPEKSGQLIFDVQGLLK